MVLSLKFRFRRRAVLKTVRKWREALTMTEEESTRALKAALLFIFRHNGIGVGERDFEIFGNRASRSGNGFLKARKFYPETHIRVSRARACFGPASFLRVLIRPTFASAGFKSFPPKEAGTCAAYFLCTIPFPCTKKFPTALHTPAAASWHVCKIRGFFEVRLFVPYTLQIRLIMFDERNAGPFHDFSDQGLCRPRADGQDECPGRGSKEIKRGLAFRGSTNLNNRGRNCGAERILENRNKRFVVIRGFPPPRKDSGVSACKQSDAHSTVTLAATHK